MQKPAGYFMALPLFLLAYLDYIYYTYETTRNEIITHVDNKLFNAAVSVKHILGDDYHDRVNAGLAISPAVYKEKSRALSEYAKQMQLAYVYAMVKRDDTVYFSASSYTQKIKIQAKLPSFLTSTLKQQN